MTAPHIVHRLFVASATLAFCLPGGCYKQTISKSSDLSLVVQDNVVTLNRFDKSATFAIGQAHGMHVAHCSREATAEAFAPCVGRAITDTIVSQRPSRHPDAGLRIVCRGDTL